MFLHTFCGRPVTIEWMTLLCTSCHSIIEPSAIPELFNKHTLAHLNGRNGWFTFYAQGLRQEHLPLEVHPEIFLWGELYFQVTLPRFHELLSSSPEKVLSVTR